MWGHCGGSSLITSKTLRRTGCWAPLKQNEKPNQLDSSAGSILCSDTSSPTSAAALAIPATTSITSGFTEVEIGGASPTGNSSYSGGSWTVQGGGAEMWGDNDNCHFTYKVVTGDCTIIAKVNSVQNTNLSAKAGVMIRTSLSQGAPRVWMAVTPTIQFEQNIQGLAVYGGANAPRLAYAKGSTALDHL